eukprot:TRINITY_DN64722_c0_g1_i1.p1 TRINITY_DN64722_c0_g1~~TRINITY_DN64722_c0_g1_i1.p1  ORF type:complete len:297 (-),score=-6.34 TRINITY_DN64722_c0_g1_i1:99-989(-)
MSGSPLLAQGKFVGLLHGGPATFGHHELSLAQEKLKTTKNRSEIQAVWQYTAKRLQNIPLSTETLKKIQNAFDSSDNPNKVRRKLMKIYGGLLEHVDPKELNYNLFLNVDHPELRLLLKCCSKLAGDLSKVEKPLIYSTMENFILSHFKDFMHRGLKIGIRAPKIGVRFWYQLFLQWKYIVLLNGKEITLHMTEVGYISDIVYFLKIGNQCIYIKVGEEGTIQIEYSAIHQNMKRLMIDLAYLCEDYDCVRESDKAFILYLHQYGLLIKFVCRQRLCCCFFIYIIIQVCIESFYCL